MNKYKLPKGIPKQLQGSNVKKKKKNTLIIKKSSKSRTIFIESSDETKRLARLKGKQWKS